jgi:hypothetical protein
MASFKATLKRAVECICHGCACSGKKLKIRIGLERSNSAVGSRLSAAAPASARLDSLVLARRRAVALRTQLAVPSLGAAMRLPSNLRSLSRFGDELQLRQLTGQWDPYEEPGQGGADAAAGASQGSSSRRGVRWGDRDDDDHERWPI